MKFKFLSIIIIWSLFFNGKVVLAKTNKILFKVNNEIITSLDILEETKYLIALNNELENTEKNKVYEIAKKSLVRHKVKELELYEKLKSFNVDNETLYKIILNQFGKIGIKSQSELKEYFEIKKIDVEHVLNRIKIQVLWNELIFAKFANQIKIDEKSIKDELENKKKQNEYLLSEILFNLETDENLNNKSDLIHKTILSKGFSEAALTFSISNTSDGGGNLGWIKEVSLNKNILKKLEKLAIGEYTKPIVVPGGYLILKIDDKRSSEINIDLEKEIKLITQKKSNEQLVQFSNMYFNRINKDIKINEY